jgi:hypothetical protein
MSDLEDLKAGRRISPEETLEEGDLIFYPDGRLGSFVGKSGVTWVGEKANKSDYIFVRLTENEKFFRYNYQGVEYGH